MNNFFWSIPHPKANQPKGTALQPTFVLRRSGRIVVPATATFMPETESPYKSKTGGAGFMTRPLKRKWGKVLPVPLQFYIERQALVGATILIMVRS